jgi:hypothetical protein
MSDQPQWYVMQGDQQLGPYTGEQLVAYATEGNIARESLIWAEGLENWMPAGEVEGVFPAQQQPVAAAAAQPAGTNVNPYATPGSNVTQAPQSGGPYPHFTVSSASFGMWIGMIIGAIILIATPTILEQFAGERIGQSAMTILYVLAGVGLLLYVFVAILTYMYIFRAWKCLAPGGMARTTPGKAIGFMFIPLFNIYWLFQAIYGLSVDWNKTVSAYPELERAPKMSEGLFMTHCILTLLFTPLAIFTVIPIMLQICRAINFFAFRPLKVAGSGFTLR